MSQAVQHPLLPRGVPSVSGLLGEVSCLRVAFGLPRIAGLTACRVADVLSSPVRAGRPIGVSARPAGPSPAAA